MMPKLVKFLLYHAAFGFLLAVVAVGLLMIGDVAGLRTLIVASDVGGLALFMLTFFLGLTFGERADGHRDRHAGRTPRWPWAPAAALDRFPDDPGRADPGPDQGGKPVGITSCA
jgi:hypothetical protein